MPNILDRLESLQLRSNKKTKRKRRRRTNLKSQSCRLPDVELGVKTSVITRQWREQEDRLHKKALRNIKSTVAQDVKKFQKELKRKEEILSFGTNNKAQALQVHLRKISQENATLAKRLKRVQDADTETSRCNDPKNMKRHMTVKKNRSRFVADSRRMQQMRIDFENALMLKRIHEAHRSLPDRKAMLKDFAHHKRITRHMSKLLVPPHEMRRRFVASSQSSHFSPLPEQVKVPNQIS